MAEFREMHDFTEYVRDENRKIYSGEAYNAVMETIVDGAGLVNRQLAIANYMASHRSNKAEANRVLKAAEKAGYLQNHKFGISVDTLSVTPYEGENFLKRVGHFRLGMYRDMLDHYSPLTPLASLLISTLLSTAAIVISILVARHVIK